MYISRPYTYYNRQAPSYPQSPYSSQRYSAPTASSYGQNNPSPTATAIAQKAKEARLKGMQDGGPVDDYKPTTDQSGATGSNDYYSALGYDESDS